MGLKEIIGERELAMEAFEAVDINDSSRVHLRDVILDIEQELAANPSARSKRADFLSAERSQLSALRKQLQFNIRDETKRRLIVDNITRIASTALARTRLSLPGDEDFDE
jgi:hypothetical protein